MKKKEIKEEIGEKLTILQACNIFKLNERNRRIANKLFSKIELTEVEWLEKFKSSKLIGDL